MSAPRWLGNSANAGFGVIVALIVVCTTVAVLIGGAVVWAVQSWIS